MNKVSFYINAKKDRIINNYKEKEKENAKKVFLEKKIMDQKNRFTFQK